MGAGSELLRAGLLARILLEAVDALLDLGDNLAASSQVCVAEMGTEFVEEGGDVGLVIVH